MNNRIKTMIDLLYSRSNEKREKVLYTFLKNGIDEHEKRTFKELHDKARSIAAAIQNYIKTGDRVLLLYPAGLPYIDAFWGSLYSGAIAVPAYPPSYKTKNEKLVSMIKDCNPATILTNNDIYKTRDKFTKDIPDIKDIKWICTDNLDYSLAEDWSKPNIKKDSVALLQYTSGSISDPKGVMVTHDNLLCNESLIADSFGVDENTIGVGWLPIYHDMGLIGNILQPVYSGFQCYLMSPFSFLKRPVVWLKAISKYGAHSSGGPNFAYDLLIGTVKGKDLENLDLSSWEVAFNGSEPIRYSTMKKFEEKFKAVGFNGKAFLPCYGLAESTLFVTGGTKQESYQSICVRSNEFKKKTLSIADNGNGIDLVGSGVIREKLQDVIIVDPDTKKECKDRQIGEIWVSGNSVAKGYWNNANKTQDTFHAYTKTTMKGPFLRTGDLGFFDKKELYVSGRIKEVIIIRGNNYYPHDIESIVESSDPVLKKGCGAAFSIDIDGEEEMIVIHEVNNHAKDINVEVLRKKIRKNLIENTGVDPSEILIVKSGSVPKTTSGKIQRIKSRELYLSKSFFNIESKNESLFEIEKGKSENEIERWITKKIAASTGISVKKINMASSLAVFGFDSVKIMELVDNIERKYGVMLPIKLLTDSPSVHKISEFIQTSSEETNQTSSSMGISVKDNHETFTSKLSLEEIYRIKMRSQKKVKFSDNMDIAIIGMSGRFPGASNLTEYWDNLKNGKESIRFFTDEELMKVGYDSEILADPDFIKAGALLENKEYFDAGFFGYSPMDAEYLDPQIRIFHEEVWSTFEDAGYNPQTYPGSIGVYAGCSLNADWILKCAGSMSDLSIYELFQLINVNFLTARVSYKLDLKGPSNFIQSTCSTALTSVVTACVDLLSNKCDMAIAGGVQLDSQKRTGYNYKKAMIMSADGHCRAFDENATGTVTGEGVGVVLLKRLDDALAERDNIHAVIKGFGTNNDGSRSASFTAPSISGQAELIKTVQKSFGITPESISYIEAHGTGTKMGDPIEIEALKIAFNTDKKEYCAVGTVKSNIGHLFSAAGQAGLIKTVLALEHKQIPPSINIEKPNPYLNIEDSPFYINRELKDWEVNGYPLRGGVSSFGMGGTNAHVIIEQAPEKLESGLGRDSEIFTLSAKTDNSLNQMISRLGVFLEKNKQINLLDVSYTLTRGRKEFNNRFATIASNMEELIGNLKNPKRKEKNKTSNKSPRVVFMFPGQGSQYSRMGYDLYRQEAFFKKHMDICFSILKSERQIDFKKIIFEGDDINESHISSCALLITEYSLAQLLLHWGIKPHIMLGHSLGEYTAACVSGVLSLKDALTLVYDRGKLIQGLPQGAMLSIFAKKENLLPLMDESVSLAVENGESHFVVSGELAAIERFNQKASDKGYVTKRLYTNRGYHSYMLDPVLDEFKDILNKIKLNSPKIPYVSDFTGQLIKPEEVKSVEYWTNQFRNTVKFNSGLEVLLDTNDQVLIEVGPGKVLSSLVESNSKYNSSHKTINTVRNPNKESSDTKYIQKKLCEMWDHGISIDWKNYYGLNPGRRVSLPGYSFEKQYYGKIFDVSMKDLSLSAGFGDSKNSLFYLPHWKRNNLVHAKTKKKLSTYLIFQDEFGIGQELAQRLGQAGNDTKIVHFGDGYNKIDESNYTVKPSKEEDYMMLFKDLSTIDFLPESIIHLWSLSDIKNDQLISMEHIHDVQESGFFSSLYMGKAIYELFDSKMKIYFVSNNVLDVLGVEEIDPGKSAIISSATVIQQESRNINCYNIDFTFSDIKNNAKRIADHISREIKLSQDEYKVAYRGNNRWTHRYENVEISENETKLKNKGVYLITGGLGGMGLTFAQFLAENYNARLVLTTRSDFPDQSLWEEYIENNDESAEQYTRVKKLLEITNSESIVMVCKADTVDLREMKDTVEAAENMLGPINGVIHTAGINRTISIKSLNKGEIIENFKPKIDGTITLFEIFKEKKPDFIIYCSSIAAIFGGYGYAGYAAANLFLDSFAIYAERKGLSGVSSINWPGWKDVGMLGGLNKKDIAIKTNYHMISPSTGIKALKRTLENDFPVITVSPDDVNELAVSTRMISKEMNSSEESNKTLSSRPQISTEYKPPETDIEKKLVQMWQELLGIEEIGIDDNFFELGGHSIKGAGFISMVEKELKIRFSFEDIYPHPTIREIALIIENINHLENKNKHTSREIEAKNDERETITI